MIILRLIAYIFRVVFFVFIASFIWRGIRKLFYSKSRTKDKKGKKKTLNRGAMVRDPLCGTWVDPQIAIKFTKGGHDYYFCSKDCMEHFKNREGSSE